jgi:hypothetical protein
VLHYWYRHVYRPECGLFCALSEEEQQIGSYHTGAAAPVSLGLLPGGAKEGMVIKGVEYKVGDALYLNPSAFETTSAAEQEEEEEAKVNNLEHMLP